MNDYLQSHNPAMDAPEPERSASRHDTDAPYEDGPIIVPNGGSAEVADPQAILAETGQRKISVYKRWVPATVGVLLFLELFAPNGVRPSQLVGDTAAQFYGAIQMMGNRNQLSYEEEQILTRMLAERQSEYAAWQGRCAMLALLDPQASAVCRTAADIFYEQAIQEVERHRQELMARSH